MTKSNQKPFENSILKELLDSEGFLGSKSKENLEDKKGFFLGFRKDFAVFDLEKSLTTYFKALSLVRSFNESSLQILFVGCPPCMEDFAKEETEKSNNIFIKEDSWVLGSLTNYTQSGLSPDLIVTFKSSRSFPSKECLKKNTPLISFIDDSCDVSFVDYPIFINLKSKGAYLMYRNLIKQSGTNVKHSI